MLFASGAVDSVLSDIDRLAPAAAPRVRPWLASLTPSGSPAERFTHRHAFPMLALPWWAEETIRGEADAAFQRELMASTVSGYLFIRLLDDVMDRDPRAVPELLPLAGLFHTLFERPYHRYFGAESEFWKHFDAAWGESADAAATDAMRGDLDEQGFHSVGSRKMAASSIPVAAVCIRAGQADQVERWSRLCALVARHEQLFDDLLDWHRDAESGRNSWILSEARRQSPSDPTRWLVCEGLTWARARLGDYGDQLRDAARAIGCRAIEPWLDDRRTLIDDLINRLTPGMEALALVADAMAPVSSRNAAAAVERVVPLPFSQDVGRPMLDA